MSSTRIQPYQQKVKKVLVQDMSKSLELLEQHVSTSSRKHSELILQLSRFNGAQREKRQGVMSSEQSNLIFNQIRAAVMYFIDDLSEEDINWDMVKDGDFASLSKPAQEYNPPRVNPLSPTEMEGLNRQRQLIEEKLNFLKEKQLLNADPNIGFSLKKQIDELVQELEKVKEKLGED